MKTPVGTVLALLCAFAARSADFTVYNVLPFSPGREAQCAEDCRGYMAATGGDLCLYSLSLHPEGRPAMEKVERYLESYRALRRELEGSGVRLGVLVQSILGHWPRVDKDIEDWTRTVNIKGEKVRFCPDDPGFAKYIDLTFAMLAKERPAFILTDDDVRAYSHDAECFCPRHVAEFNERRGTKYTEAELRKRLSSVRQGDPDYVAFLAVQREMMERLVKRFRAAIDSVDPSIPAGAFWGASLMWLHNSTCLSTCQLGTFRIFPGLCTCTSTGAGICGFLTNLPERGAAGRECPLLLPRRWCIMGPST